MPFATDTTAIWQNAANVLAAMMSIAWPFVGATLALFIFGGLLYLLHQHRNNN